MANHSNITTDPISPSGPAPRAQACSASMRLGLVKYWNFTGGGTTVLSAPGGHALTLGRTNRSSGASISTTGGWTTEPVLVGTGRPTYNGHGSVAFSGLSLASAGNAITIAARVWLKGGNIQGGVGPLAKAVQILGLGGQYGSGSESGLSLVVPDASLCLTVPTTAGFQLRQWTGSSALTLNLTGATAWPDPMLCILTLERVGSVVNAQLWVNGDAAGPTVALSPALIDLTRITFGDAVESDGSVTEGAIWNRKLQVGEIMGQAFDLTCVYSVGEVDPPPVDPETWPLLNDDGTSSVAPEWVVPLEHTHGVIASAGPARSTRQTHERRPRRYGLRIRLGNGKEALILQEVLRVTRMGAMWTRWRHPKDDPVGPPSTAPRYRVVNAADGTMALTRPNQSAGAVADFTLVLEDV